MINVWDYLEEYEIEKDEILSAIESVLGSGKLILGPNVVAFEKEFSQWCGSSHGVGVGNGTDAIFLALKALKLSPGDEVITVANTAVPTVSAITAAGGVPVFIDVDPNTYLMDVDLIETKITSRTKGVIAVHLFGQCVNMLKLKDVCEKFKLWIIEDCAQSHGAMFLGQKAGTMSDISTFSFYPTKILGTYGDGGFCMTNSIEHFESLKKLRFYGMEKTYYSIEQGYNSRLDELHAAILRKKLEKLGIYIHKRKVLASKYDQELKNSIYITPAVANGNSHAYYLYVLQHNDRDRIIEDLKKNGIIVNISYPWPIHTMHGFEYLGYKIGDLPVTESLARRIFSIPMYPSLSENSQNFIIETLLDIQ